MLKNLRIRMKLIVTFSIVMIMVVGLIFLSLDSLKNVSSHMEEFYDTSYKAATTAWEVRRDIRYLEADIYHAMAEPDLQATAAIIADAQKNAEDFNAKLTDLKKYMPSAEADIDSAIAIAQNARQYRVAVLDLAGKNQNAEAYALMKQKYAPELDKIIQLLVKIGDTADKESQAFIDDANQTSNRTMLILIGIGVAVAIVIVVLALLAARNISGPINQCVDRLRLLAQGDLKSPLPHIESRDEAGELSSSMNEAITKIVAYIKDIDKAMGEMAKGNFDLAPSEPFIGDFKSIENSISSFIVSISDTLTQINMAAMQVSNGSEQVSSGAQALAQGATEQASSVQQLSASIAEISEQVKLNAANSNKAKEMANKAANAVESSNTQMQKLMSAMNEINDKSGQIGKIIKTIEDIAFQTNILALNAAVEAARAGAAGKGFAVVADEVRNLASKSGEAAKNTTELIEGSIAAVDNGTRLAEETAKELLGIVDGTSATTQLIGEVTQASNEQAVSIAQINQGIEQISSVVQTNSATSEESAAASEELSGQATLMRELISKFKVKNINNTAYSPSVMDQYSYSPQEADPYSSSSQALDNNSYSPQAMDTYSLENDDYYVSTPAPAPAPATPSYSKDDYSDGKY